MTIHAILRHSGTHSATQISQNWWRLPPLLRRAQCDRLPPDLAAVVQSFPVPPAPQATQRPETGPANTHNARCRAQCCTCWTYTARQGVSALAACGTLTPVYLRRPPAPPRRSCHPTTSGDRSEEAGRTPPTTGSAPAPAPAPSVGKYSPTTSSDRRGSVDRRPNEGGGGEGGGSSSGGMAAGSGGSGQDDVHHGTRSGCQECRSKLVVEHCVPSFGRIRRGMCHSARHRMGLGGGGGLGHGLPLQGHSGGGYATPLDALGAPSGPKWHKSEGGSIHSTCTEVPLSSTQSTDATCVPGLRPAARGRHKPRALQPQRSNTAKAPTRDRPFRGCPQRVGRA